MNDFLILVDDNDNEIGYSPKMEAHMKELLHRAFSLFIFNVNSNKMLLQKRATGKYHSGGLWANACCSHPRKGEDIRAAVLRRTKEELGILISKYYSIADLIELSSFKYYCKYDGCAEHEIDHVFLLIVKEHITLKINKREISEVRWVSIPDLIEELNKKNDIFTAWFPKAFKIVLEYLSCSSCCIPISHWLMDF